MYLVQLHDVGIRLDQPLEYGNKLSIMRIHTCLDRAPLRALLVQ